jgi:hypothetical protein
MESRSRSTNVPGQSGRVACGMPALRVNNRAGRMASVNQETFDRCGWWTTVTTT